MQTGLRIHINMKKSCYMHFRPKGICCTDQHDITSDKINDYEIVIIIMIIIKYGRLNTKTNVI